MVLMVRELKQGAKNFIFIWVIIAPLIISLLLSLVFGDLFSSKPKLGLFDQGNSHMVEMLGEMKSIITKKYHSPEEIRKVVEKGAVDFGIILPANFDSSLRAGETVKLEVLVGGESLAKNRSILGVAIVNLARRISGHESPIEIETITLGEGKTFSWQERFLPLIVLLAVFLSGTFIPATSLIEEKIKGTLQALIVTPTTVLDVVFAKGLTGILISMLMGMITLVLNNAFSSQPSLLITLLLLGSIMACLMGLILGSFIKNIATLFSIWKVGGIVLFFPALVYIFPQMPAFLGKLFPTYYLIEPLWELTQGSKGWAEMGFNILILIGIDLLLIILLIALLKIKKPLTAAV